MRDNKKRILHIIDTTGPAGAEIVLLNILRGLNDSKFKSFVILPDKGWLYKRLLPLRNIDIKIINGTGRMNVLFIYLLSKFVLKNKINIIHSHLFGSSLYCSIVGILCRVPVVCTFHGFADIDPKDNLLKLKFFIISIGSKKIVSVSDELGNYLRRMLLMRGEKCVTIYNGIELKENGRIARESARQRLEFSKSDILVGSVGNIKKAKGYDVLLKVASIIRRKYPNCFFVVAGEGKGELFNELLVERKRLGLEKAVYFIGFQEDVSAFLSMIDIFLLTSNTEGFSLSTIEAMNAGVPVVVTKSGGPQEIVINYRNGIVADVGDEIGLANGIIKLIENDVIRRKLVASAKKTVSDRFRLSTMIQKYEALYATLAKGIFL